MPVRLRQALGPEVADAFISWLGDAMGEEAVQRSEWLEVRDEMGGVMARLDAVEKRLDAVEFRLVAVERDLSEFRVDFREFRSDVTLRFDSLHGRFDELHRQMLAQTRWTVGLLGLFGTIIAVFYAIGQLKP
jgi:hypothetical protein